MSHQKIQHYVPQFLLRNFCFNKNYLYCFDKQNRNIFSPNVKNVACESYFYDLENGKPEYSFENLINQVEDRAAEGIRKLVQHKNLKLLNANDYQRITFFLAVQLVRSKSERENIKNFNQAISNYLRSEGYEPGFVENFNELKCEQEVKEAALYNLRNASDLYPLLLNKRWILYISDDEFITSDNPITKQNTLFKNKLGISSKGIEIYFPLSSSVELCLLCEESFKAISKQYETYKYQLSERGHSEAKDFVCSVRDQIPIKCRPETIENLNSLQVIFSERFLFSRKNDFYLAEDMINCNDKLRSGLRTQFRIIEDM